MGCCYCIVFVWLAKQGRLWQAAEALPPASRRSANRWDGPYRWSSFLSLFVIHMFKLRFNAQHICCRTNTSTHCQNHCMKSIYLLSICGISNRAIWRNACRDTWSRMPHETGCTRSICICICTQCRAPSCLRAPDSCAPWTYGCRSIWFRARPFCSPGAVGSSRRGRGAVYFYLRREEKAERCLVIKAMSYWSTCIIMLE